VSGFHERADLFSSVAFWYQTGQAKRFATIPPADERVVPETLIELEDLTKAAKATPVGIAIESKRFSGTNQLLAKCNDPAGTLTIPFKLDAKTQGIARLRIGTLPESGIWSVALDGKTIEGFSLVDLYSATPGVREIRIGTVDLAAGEHSLSFECKGRNPASQSCWLGVDALAIDRITPYAVPAGKK
jgi:hypothetical protein